VCLETALTKRVATIILAFVLDGRLPFDCHIPGSERLLVDDSFQHPSITSLPVEIKSSTIQGALDYMTDLRLGSIPTYRSKIMLVGFPGIGKTSLVQSLYTKGGYFASKALLGLTKTYSVILLHGPSLVIYRSAADVARVLLDRSYEIKRTKNTIHLKYLPRSVSWLEFRFRSTVQPSSVHEPSSSVEVSSAAPQLGTLIQSDLYFVFGENEGVCDEWMSWLSHWVSNVSTKGIETTTRRYPKKCKGEDLEVCVMDFAGQGE
jgi:GTPase SAR1 family protein